MIYRLSNRQLKELRERSRPLRIALPLPPDDELPADLLKWARQQLPDVADAIARVQVGQVICSRLDAPGLVAILGQIQDDWSEDHASWCTSVAIVHLEPARPRHGPLPVQWPGSCGDAS